MQENLLLENEWAPKWEVSKQGDVKVFKTPDVTSKILHVQANEALRGNKTTVWE